MKDSLQPGGGGGEVGVGWEVLRSEPEEEHLCGDYMLMMTHRHRGVNLDSKWNPKSDSKFHTSVTTSLPIQFEMSSKSKENTVGTLLCDDTCRWYSINNVWLDSWFDCFGRYLLELDISQEISASCSCIHIVRNGISSALLVIFIKE